MEGHPRVLRGHERQSQEESEAPGKDHEHSRLVHMPELLFLPYFGFLPKLGRLRVFYPSIIIKAYNFFFTQLGTSKKEVVGSLSQKWKKSKGSYRWKKI